MQKVDLSVPVKIHFIGISGAGMLPLSLCLKQSGSEVSGEDDGLTREAKEILEANQISVAPVSMIRADDVVVVYSSAVKHSHPSMVEAKQRAWKLVSRGKCLAEIAKQKRLIAVAGSHGKTSTTGILIDLLERLGENPSYVIGGLFATGKPPGKWSDSNWMIAEIDESDGTIEEFSPEITLILNADHDHHTQYETESEYRNVFKRLGERTTGKVILGDSLRESIGLCLNENKTVYPRRFDDTAVQSNQIGRFSRLNQQIAMAALEVAGFDGLRLCMKTFTPIRRRQSWHYFSPSLKVIEDYAHHPVEIAAIREGLRSAIPGKMIAVFQPHRYSRTLSLKNELAEELSKFDFVYLLDVYEASEEPVLGGTGKDLYRACKSKFDHCDFVLDKEILLRRLADHAPTNGPQIIVFLGAGRTDEMAKRYVENRSCQDPRWGTLFSDIAKVANFDSKICSNESLDNKTTLRVGGAAEMYFEPASEGELVAALIACHRKRIPVFPLGRGSNIIVPDEGVSGLVIRLSHAYWKRFEVLSPDEIRVGSGMRIKELCGIACREGLEGFEFLEGIPGSIGGALRMNAGAMGGWMFDVVKSVRFAKRDGTVVEAVSADLSIGYRHCRELEDAIALDAVLAAKAIGQAETELRKTIDVYQSKRKESQPREPSAGCIFKNPEGHSAGRLIEELGLKGSVIGGAEISGVHGNFIVNRGGATSEDVIELIRLVRRVANTRRSIDLEPEALLYGGDWKEVLR